LDLDRQPDEVINLWPNAPPGAHADLTLNEHYVYRDNEFGLLDRAAHEVTTSTLTRFKPQKPNGHSILIIPGGGYGWVVVEKEGFEGARYFNELGYDVFVLKYRLPHQGWSAGPDTPLQDTQRAIRLIRQLTSPSSKLTVMGFSAGGHLAGSLLQRFDDRLYDPVDTSDLNSARPDFGVLVYPVALMTGAFAHQGSRTRLIGQTPTQKDEVKYDLTLSPNPNSPPVFLLHALDDKAVPVENSLQLTQAYQNAGVSAVLHTFQKGGHGFGLRGIDKLPVRIWPTLMHNWIMHQSLSN
jgi:acetyl esterase/lipase